MQIRQVVVTGQEQVELQHNFLDEQTLGPHELLIESEWSFISTGTELANYTGREPKVFQAGTWCAYPWRSGYANCGVVRAIGSAVTRAHVGERVFTYGRHASAFIYDENRLVVAVPTTIDPAVAAASRMAAVAATSIIVSEIRGDPWVAIFGLGLVGNLAAQMFRIRGCRVIGVDPVAQRRQLAIECGIEQTVGGTAAEVQRAIADLTHGELVDITVDAVGDSRVVMQALHSTATFGQLVILGSPRVAVEGNLTELLSDVHLRFITLRGALEWLLPMYPTVGKHESQFSKQMMIFDWIERGLLRIEPLISHRLPPEQIKTAYEGLLRQPQQYTGVLLDWRQ
ncbi:MAG TPA: zinc-binding alcohol dehydrogenase [Caldilineaceae bacterium]|nr:zinc-binding alcohol dehydrogenase [Caldilineaceae bacterium]